MQNNLLSLFLAIVPVFLYSFLVYFMVPYKYVSQRRARRYLFMGMLSPLLVLAFNYAFPLWSTPISSYNPLAVCGYSAFFQVGLVEEVAKFSIFWIVFNQRKSAVHDLPIATMYYCMMIAAGFAIVENISYLFNFGEQVLFVRAASALPMHLIVGIFMGYYIQMGFSKIMMSEKYSFKEIFKMNFHKWSRILLGILMATIFHAMYDLNLFLPFNIYSEFFLFVILFFGLVLCKFMIDNAIRVSKELRNQNYKKDLEFF